MAEPAKPYEYRNKWRVKWVDHEGKRRSKNFDRGQYNEAVAFLAAQKTEANEVRAGVRRPSPRVEHSFGDVLDHYERERIPLKRSGADDLSIIRRHLRPAFGHLRLREIGLEHLDRYKRERVSLAPNTIRNHLALLSVLFKLAVRLGWMNEAPPIEKPRSETAAKLDHEDRPWLRTADEVRRFLTAARHLGPKLHPDRPTFLFTLYAFALGTGLRAGEVAGLRWTEVDFTRRTINVRRSFNGRTKTHASRRFVPIVDDLLPVLQGWLATSKPLAPDALVFPNTSGNMLEPAARCFHEHLHRVLDAADFKRPERAFRIGVHALHFHSLRHSFACWWVLSGGRLDHLQEAMGHVSKEMTRYYANVGGYAHREDFSRLQGLLLLEPLPSNVVSLRR